MFLKLTIFRPSDRSGEELDIIYSRLKVSAKTIRLQSLFVVSIRSSKFYKSLCQNKKLWLCDYKSPSNNNFYISASSVISLVYTLI